MAKRTTVITIEQHNLTMRREAKVNAISWCQACATKRVMLTVEQAARCCSVTERAIFRLVENRIVHFDESQAGHLLICAESLRVVTDG